MASIAPVENGKIQETASQSSLKKANSSTDGMDKDSFLQLLVAQMKYQDPLEPTSNTEYISQYAQFSQVEQMQNMSGSMELQRASALVGKDVYVKTTTSSGDPKYVQGRVDYVAYENGKAYLSIDEDLYSLEDLDTVADKEYMEACEVVNAFKEELDKLPSLENVGETDAPKIMELSKRVDAMTDYQKHYLSSDSKATISKYIEKLSELAIYEA